MKIVLSRSAGVAVVDGDSRKIDLSTLDPAIDVVFFDTAKLAGQIQWAETVSETVIDRDLKAEAVENARREKENLSPLETPIMVPVQIHRRPTLIEAFTPYNKYLDLWTAAAPVPPPPPTQAQVTAQALAVSSEATITGLSFGPVTPKTRAELQAMTFTEYSAWFDLNFDTLARVLGLIKRITFIIIRRAL